MTRQDNFGLLLMNIQPLFANVETNVVLKTFVSETTAGIIRNCTSRA